ncbi:MAG: hypothetical protein JKX69_10060 [Rhodobacteraceae bacterium]|nr:hypothetical protein [Paracoccaceae bacterium]
MKYDTLEERGLNYAPCRYDASKIFFRGPKRSLNGQYAAFVGGTETYGKFVAEPFPALVEEAVGMTCVNFGCVNASIGAFLSEGVVVDACHRAALNIVQVMGAQNLSNRFYTVHPRRNDRFLRASTVLQAIFPEVDFADYCFTRHLLGALYEVSPERFEIVRSELEQAWLARMRGFLGEIGSHTLLMWFSDHLPTDVHWAERENPLQSDPLFISKKMLDSLRPLVHSVVMVRPSSKARASGTEGMVYAPQSASAAAELLGAAAHREAADAIIVAMRTALSGAA